MGNQLFNSMVRGFGMTLGRKAANAVTAPSASTPKVSKRQLKLEQERQDHINKHIAIRDKFQSILVEVEESYKKGDITLTEYNICKTDCLDGIQQGNLEIQKLQNVEIKEEGGSVLKTLLILSIIGTVLYGMLT
jgi:hypothetical protein